MKTRQIVLVVLAFTFLNLSAQVMNVRKWRASERDSLDNGMFLIEEEQFLEAIPIFEQMLNNHPNEEFLRYTYAKCALYRGDKHEDAYKYLSELYGKNKKIPELQFDMALAAHYAYEFDQSEEILRGFLLNKRVKGELRGKGEQLKRWIASARVLYNQPTGARVTNMGPAINSQYDEYRPAISADDSLLFFNYAGSKSIGGLQNVYMQPDPFGEFREDIHYSYKKGSGFDSSRALESLNSNLPDAVVSITPDGRQLFLYQELGDGHGDLYLSSLSGESYLNPVKIQGEVNSYSWDGHCSVSPDGKTMYFSSERPGGYGRKDIYKATLQADSTWGNVTNLGDSINSPWDEDAPFIHADGVTLFFSSRGKNSMGGYDIFRAVLNKQDSLFGNAQNLGYPLNTSADDLYFVLTADGKQGYHSSARKNGFGMRDIYSIDPALDKAVEPVYLVKGVTSDNGSPVEAEIKVETRESSPVVVRTLRSNSVNGSYLFVLPGGNDYKVTFSLPGKSNTLDLEAASLSQFQKKIFNVDFNPVADSLPLAAAPANTTATSGPLDGDKALNESGPVNEEITKKSRSQGLSAGSPLLKKDASFPKTGMQEKAMRYAKMYGKVSHPDVEFRIQLAAVKTNSNPTFPNTSKLGKIERLNLGDGYTRITAGGKFKTLEQALEHNRKVVKAGQQEGFILAIYKGKKVSYDELEEQGVFVKE